MSGGNQLRLEVGDILEHIKNAIDNEALWIKHYGNLREIEKDLPEEETKKDLPEDSQEAKSLDELLISDFLNLELKIYGIKNINIKETMGLVISKIKDIEKFIPMVFNFKERLKLVLCAVSHMDMDKGLISLVTSNLSYDDIVDKFKMLDEIKMLEVITNASEDSPENYDITELNKFLAKKKQIVFKHESTIDNFQQSIKRSLEATSSPVPTKAVTRSATRSATNRLRGGANNGGPQNNSSHNTVFDGITTLEGKNPLEELINSYNKQEVDDVDKIDMFQNLLWINFSKFRTSKLNEKGYHNNKLETLKNRFKSYIDNSATPLSDKQKERVKSLVDEFDDFSLFKKYLPTQNFKEVWFVKYFDEHVPILSLILGEDGPGEAKAGDAAAAAAQPQEVFNKYIEKVFEYSYAKLLIEKNIIEEEIKHQKKVEKQKHRFHENIDSVFESAKNPLLRMFLFFVSECVHDMSSKIQNISQDVANSFWDNLENNFPNKISLQDEIVNGKSLFNYVKSELEKKSGGTDEQKTVIDGLVIKSKLIYLLQNYHYF